MDTTFLATINYLTQVIDIEDPAKSSPSCAVQVHEVGDEIGSVRYVGEIWRGNDFTAARAFVEYLNG